MKTAKTYLIIFFISAALSGFEAFALDDENAPKTTGANSTSQTNKAASAGSVFVVCSEEFTNTNPKLGRIQLGILQSIELATGRKEWGIRIEGDGHLGPGGSYSPIIRTLEYGELDSLLKALDDLSKLDKSITPLRFFKATWETRSGLAFSVTNEKRQYGRERNGVSSMESIEAPELGARITTENGTHLELSLDEFNELRGQIASAKAKLTTLKEADERGKTPK
jgi:hypothetical protein